jgi:PAS domain S-box-containing protein
MKVDDLVSAAPPSIAERFHMYLTKGAETAELSFIRPDGELRTVEYTATRMSAGRHFAIIRDITHRRRDEEAHKESEERFMAFMNYLPCATFIKDRDGRYLFLNDITAATHGRKDSLGKTDNEIFPAEVSAVLRANDQKVLNTGIAAQVIETACIDGELREWLTTKFPIRDKDGQISSVGGVAFDITGRRRTEEALHESELRLRQMAECCPDVFWMGDPYVSKIYYLSPAYEAVWGRSCKGIYENPMSYKEAIHPADLERVVTSLNADNVRVEHRLEFRIVRPDLTVRWIAEHRFPVFNEAGEFIRVAGISRDITSQKQAESALKASLLRLQSLSCQLLEAQEAERRRIARELHDEVGQQLTAVKLNIDAARNSEKPASIHDESMEIVDRILMVIRELSLELRPTDLDDLGLVTALKAHFNRQAQRAGIRIDFSAVLPVRLPQVIETACFRIAQEALTNIIRHARARNVIIKLTRSETEVLMQIVDDGIGFNVPASLAKASEGGSIGLLGMQERAQSLGGRLNFESPANKGATISVRIPLI